MTLADLIKKTERAGASPSNVKLEFVDIGDVLSVRISRPDEGQPFLCELSDERPKLMIVADEGAENPVVECPECGHRAYLEAGFTFLDDTSAYECGKCGAKLDLDD